MLRTYSTNISTTANSNIVFNTNKIATSSIVTHNEGGATISVNAPGYYLVTLDASYTAAAAGPVIIQLYADNTAIPDAIINSQVAANENVNNSFTTIIKATPGMVGNKIALTVRPDVDITIANIALGVNRISSIR